MKVTIELNTMSFYGHHGCYELEQKIGTHFEVDVTIKAEVGKAAENDDLEGTVNYLTVFEVTKIEMAKSSKTIENVALRIQKAIFEKFPNCETVKVKVSKMAPALGGKVEKSCVTIE